MQHDIIYKFSPKDCEIEWDELPPKISNEHKARMEANDKANAELKRACEKAFAMGRIHLVSVHFASGPGPQQEADDIDNAVANVKARGLQDEGDNARLIEEGEKWVKTLRMETYIVEAIEKAWPSLTIDFNDGTQPPIPGAPWMATTVGHALQCDKRRAAWSEIEDLSQAIKISSNGGASHGLTEIAREVLADLIARTPELPADRCVLDPDGKGVKLLPKGRQRALWYHTGDSYMYQPDKEKAGELNNFDLPPTEELANTSVKNARPICATYAKARNCKLGKRCPWRHAVPMEGDVVREPIMFS
jgi:hypothetical protein